MFKWNTANTIQHLFSEIQRIGFILDSIGNISNGSDISGDFCLENYAILCDLLQIPNNEVCDEFGPTLYLLPCFVCIYTYKSCVGTDVNKHQENGKIISYVCRFFLDKA